MRFLRGDRLIRRDVYTTLTLPVEGTADSLNGTVELYFQRTVTPLLGATKAAAGTSSNTLTATAQIYSANIRGIGERVDKWRFNNVYQFPYARLTPWVRSSSTRLGTAAITIIPTATARAVSAGAGAAAVTCTPTASIVGIAAIAGSADMAIAATAITSISGTVELTLSATITTSSVGTSDITITPAATLTGTGNLQASEPLVLSMAAPVIGIGRLIGASEIVFTAAWNPIPPETVRGIGQRIDSRFRYYDPTPTGAYLNIPTSQQTTVSGTCSVTITPTAALTGIGRLAGAATLDLGGSGSAGGASSSIAAMIFTPVALPRADGALVGRCDVTVDGAGPLLGLVQMIGVAAMETGASLDIEPPSNINDPNISALTVVRNIGTTGSRSITSSGKRRIRQVA